MSDSFQTMAFIMSGFLVLHQLPGCTQTHSFKSVMPSNHLILCLPLLLLPSVYPSIRVLSNESVLQVAKIPELQHQPSYEYSELILGLTGLSPCCPRDSQASSPSRVQKHQFFSAQLSLWPNSHIHT